MARRLCIVSGTPLQCNAFVPALESLRPDDELEIISDRRRGDASGEAKAERRSRPFLDLASLCPPRPRRPHRCRWPPGPRRSLRRRRVSVSLPRQRSIAS